MTRIRATLAVIGLAAVSSLCGLPLPGLGPAPVTAQVQVDLRDADLRNFIEIVSEATGRSYVLDPGVRGAVTVLSPGSLTPDELYQVFLSVLEVNRLTVVDGNGADRIVPMNVAREMSSGGTAGAPEGFETRVIPVENIPLQEVVEVVRPLLPAEAVLSPVPGSKLLILSDRAANHARITRLIQQLDRPRETPIEMIRLRNANASDVLQVVQSMNIIPDGAAVSADRRSNALVISGPDSLREQVRILAARLDTQQNNTSSHAVPLNYADATALAGVVLQAIDGGSATEGTGGPIRIVPETSTNTLLITAPRERLSEIVEMIHYLDRRPTQVLVEAVIFEMSSEGFSDLSAQFGAVLNNALVGGAQFALDGRSTLTGVISALRDGDTPDAGNGGLLGGYHQRGDSGVVGLLSAIASSNSTRLLSTPSILTLNNQEAEIVVAQNVPFVTGSYSTVSDSSSVENPFQTIERQDVGLTLNVTPQINADRTVKMVIKQEVSNLTNSTSSAGGEITAKRTLSTTALVRDGNVIMLGGLLEDGDGMVSQRVPGLSDIPFVGGMFRGKNVSDSQRVLLVMMRPQVVSNDAEAEALTRRLASEAKGASLAMRPLDDGSYPRTPTGSLPFDGADLNQPFDAGFVDDIAQSRNFPPLPSRLRFSGN